MITAVNKVSFRVLVDPAFLRSNNHKVFVAGNCAELGNWSVQNAVELSRKRCKASKCKSSAMADKDDSPVNDEGIWGVSFKMAERETIEYRYFIGLIDNIPDDKSVSKKVVSVHNYEMIKRCRTVAPFSTQKEKEMSVYGIDNDTRKSIGRGWLENGQFEIRVCLSGSKSVLLHGDETPSSKITQYYINCSTVDFGSSKNVGKCCGKSKEEILSNVSASVIDDQLGNHQDGVREGKSGALLCGEEQFLSFCIVTRHPGDFGFQIDIHSAPAVNTTKTETGCFSAIMQATQRSHCSLPPGQKLGTAHLCAPSAADISGRNGIEMKQVSIMSSHAGLHEIVGTLEYSIFVIGSAPESVLNTLDLQHDCFKQSTSGDVDHRVAVVGHRGMGVSICRGGNTACWRENTVESFTRAAAFGADMVEFDVLLTKDDVPVVYHDFHTTITVKTQDSATTSSPDSMCKTAMIRIPVQDLSLEELSTFDVFSVAERSYNSRQDNKSVATDEHSSTGKNLRASHAFADLHNDARNRAFPMLRELFNSVDIRCGFNVEVKHPIRMLNGQLDEGLKMITRGRNEYLDAILAVVFECASVEFKKDGSASGCSEGRKIIFSSFDPDICAALRAKQNRYPVFFLSVGDKMHPYYLEPRTRSMEHAINFALSESLAGIDICSDPLVGDPEIIHHAKDLGLAVYCWESGGSINAEKIRQLKKNGVDGIILDRCNELMDVLRE